MSSLSFRNCLFLPPLEVSSFQRLFVWSWPVASHLESCHQESHCAGEPLLQPVAPWNLKFTQEVKVFIFTYLFEKHQSVVASHMAPTGDLAHNPGMCPDWELNQRPFGSQPTLNLLSYTSQGEVKVFSASHALWSFHILFCEKWAQENSQWDPGRGGLGKKSRTTRGLSDGVWEDICSHRGAEFKPWVHYLRPQIIQLVI